MSMVEIDVRATIAPDGRPGVLLQLPDGWSVMTPGSARIVAELLIAAAGEIEAGPVAGDA